ncbi:MAG: hypothetical protein AB7G06_03310 [Bdellovibrionales bacterium]
MFRTVLLAAAASITLNTTAQAQDYSGFGLPREFGEGQQTETERPPVVRDRGEEQQQEQRGPVDLRGGHDRAEQPVQYQRDRRDRDDRRWGRGGRDRDDRDWRDRRPPVPADVYGRYIAEGRDAYGRTLFTCVQLADRRVVPVSYGREIGRTIFPDLVSMNGRGWVSYGANVSIEERPGRDILHTRYANSVPASSACLWAYNGRGLRNESLR